MKHSYAHAKTTIRQPYKTHHTIIGKVIKRKSTFTNHAEHNAKTMNKQCENYNNTIITHYKNKHTIATYKKIISTPHNHHNTTVRTHSQNAWDNNAETNNYNNLRDRIKPTQHNSNTNRTITNNWKPMKLATSKNT